MLEPRPDVIAGVHRIAVLRPGALGDFVFTLPALDALHRTYPDAEIVLLGRGWHADFLRRRPGPVHRVVVVPPARGVTLPSDVPDDAAELGSWFKWMQREHFDIALQLHGGGRYSNPFVSRLGARVTAGFRTADAAPLDRSIRYVYHQNERVRQLEAVGLIGASSASLAPTLVVTASDVAEADGVLPDGWRECRDKNPLVVLQPGATDARRRWPVARFAALADALIAKGARIAINGSAEERGLTGELIAAMRAPALDLAGRLSLRGLAGLLSRARLVVSNDTGPLYLAEAVGVATVGIYWLTNLANSGPLSCARHRHALSLRTNCPTCGRQNIDERCEHDESFVADVSVDAVLAPALDLLREPAPPSPALHHALPAYRYA